MASWWRHDLARDPIGAEPPDRAAPSPPSCLRGQSRRAAVVPAARGVSPKNAATVGATSTVCAADDELVPRRTRGGPPDTKNGIGSVAGWPWLPGIGLEAGRGR